MTPMGSMVLGTDLLGREMDHSPRSGWERFSNRHAGHEGRVRGWQHRHLTHDCTADCGADCIFRTYQMLRTQAKQCRHSAAAARRALAQTEPGTKGHARRLRSIRRLEEKAASCLEQARQARPKDIAELLAAPEPKTYHDGAAGDRGHELLSVLST